ncbi:UDP-galactopyranose mutase [Leptospira sp. 2 VSF19]|uniref:UDP-galactopyranose mutase n=1 Tax=Leptospira soteropolitanensis TaxID=2950025 RepID=A0AAW5VPF0_9LEPT|nr:UDP-galactopyranose mutase [Leptospira soteropolitanensis]MCW7493194.1 UDP-galactopyranose mutase [Leptospira soteropolitanensis]MCW7500737.1 UDP-galactopyranose mutase [Leptospira soteropolitanensis]MCW7523044.1 UDP-galactopyranose mutase [Leptospira soteropolitanensis]MCW7526849.1 UDP-galactopyranose mutase [Leptospira soteropolitanensis]MCW7530762.1 UDP-galactopyranose mutase [Leptospira soteropolitanensis]
MKKILIIGAGFSGAVVANSLAKTGRYSIDVIDERNHIGGNCHTERDKETGIMVHKYGPHIFHTSNKLVWDYVNQFDRFHPFVNRVKSIYNGQVYSLPINLHTINQFYGKALSPGEAIDWIQSKGDKSIQEPKTFEEQAKKFVGEELYKAFFYGYTKKQWGCEPSELPASILKRLPVRFSYDDNYYNDRYQGIPENGYSYVIERILAHDLIRVKLNQKFSGESDIDLDYHHIFYTGPIDAFFSFRHGRLGYRTVYFKDFREEGDHQGNPVINYADESVPYTRIHEHKHFTPWESFDKTIYFEEYSKETTETDIPYYPKRLESDLKKLKLYEEEVRLIQKVSFLGRLATYRYLDMHHIIEEALDCAAKFLESDKSV